MVKWPKQASYTELKSDWVKLSPSVMVCYFKKQSIFEWFTRGDKSLSQILKFGLILLIKERSKMKGDSLTLFSITTTPS